MTIDPPLAVSLIALVGAGVGWLLVETKGKGRLETVEPRVATLSASASEHDRKLAALETKHEGLVKELERLDRDKAGREVVETLTGFLRDMKAEFAYGLREMKADILDRIERLERLERSKQSRDGDDA